MKSDRGQVPVRSWPRVCYLTGTCPLSEVPCQKFRGKFGGFDESVYLCSLKNYIYNKKV